LQRKKTTFLVIISHNVNISQQTNNAMCVITYMELFIGNTVLYIYYAPSTYFCVYYLLLNSQDHNRYLKKTDQEQKR